MRKIKIELVIFSVVLVLGILCMLSYFEMRADHVLLNEVCCYNDTIIYDTDGVYQDYIELYNPMAESKDISGFYLSDDKDNLEKYTFPENTVIKSGEYFTIWAGFWNKNIMLEDETAYTGFGLSAGETVYLSDENGRVIDKITIPQKIERDVAYSRVGENGNEWMFTQGTPKAANVTELPMKEVLLDAEVYLSVEPGFYEEPFYLELKSAEELDIYYTLDGSEPNNESMKYTNPILIEDVSNSPNKYAGIKEIVLTEDEFIPENPVEKAVVVRAVAVDNEGNKSKTINGTYFIGYQDKVGFSQTATISIITDPENLFGYEHGIYVTGKLWDMNEEIAKATKEYWYQSAPTNYSSSGLGWRRNAVIQYFDEKGKMRYNQNVALGMHGATSLAKNQKSFNLYALPESDGNEYVLEGIFGRLQKDLMLRNSGGRDCYSVKIRDGVNLELVSERDVTVLDYAPCQVFLDGEYWGLYMLQERVSASMIASKYPVEEDNVVIIKNEAVADGVDEDAKLWSDVVAFATGNDLRIEKNYRKMESLIDIQSCIDHYCFQIYVANCDSISNNNAKWRVRETGKGEYNDGKWRWILYDTDTSSGIIPYFTGAEVDSFIEGNYGRNALTDPFFIALIQNEEFKERFVTSFMDMANDCFAADKVISRYDELAEQLQVATVTSHKRFVAEVYSTEDYMTELSVVKDFFKNRYGYIVNYMKNDLALEGDLVQVTVANEAGGVVRLNTFIIGEEETFNGNYYSDYSIKLSAEPRDGHILWGWMVNEETYVQEELVLELVQDYIIMPIWEEIND